MPQPNFLDMDWDPEESPDPRMELMGRGAKARKSKTLLPNIELAVILGLTKEHIQHLFELFRKLHAANFSRLVEVEDDDGTKSFKEVPHILTDQEIREIYPSVKKWESFHQEQVEHYPSVGGFSTKAAFSYDQEAPRKERKESSAGTDQKRWE